MALNKKDFVVVNGKRYYADGGSTGPGDDFSNWIKGRHFQRPKGKTTKKDIKKSKYNGHAFYEHLDDDLKNEQGELIYNKKTNGSRKNDVKEGLKNAVEYMKFYESENPGILEKKYGLNIKDFDNINLDNVTSSKKRGVGEGIDDKKYGRLAYFLSDVIPDEYKDRFFVKSTNNMVDDEKFNYIPIGANSLSSIGQFRYGDINYLTDAQKEAISQKFPYLIKKTKDGKYDTGQWAYSTFQDSNGNIHVNYPYNFKPVGNGDYEPTNSQSFVLDKDNNFLWLSPIGRERKLDKDGNGFYTHKDYNIVPEGTNGAVQSIENIGGYNHIKKSAEPYFRKGNMKRIHFSNDNDRWTNYASENYPLDEENYSQGGHLNRYYADGGAMGQIPLGEQMPEDYNMVGEGGMHEENPMGGVPYGINQDGSQNMVEEGEVSVGDNVFSNRTQLSPELCQQLGLPEGTTPAEAMQQIEQLYEQGQLSEEEFQEVQQIIFQDQEQQKQNDPSSYQQGQVGGQGVPMPQNEGIDPSMIQGAPMDQQQMDPSMMQNEGITPDMVQGGF